MFAPAWVRTRQAACACVVAAAALGCGPDESTGPGGAGTGGAGGAEPRAEAGFIEVPPATVVGPPYAARVFYSFQPAEAGAEDAPLLLFFNGGPGAATSGTLMVYGTGPFTLDPDASLGAKPAPNPEPYTRFANLLFVDERQAGFSYGVAPIADCLEGPAGYVEDAADYLFALLEFLDGRPELVGRRVVLVGESYGGTRAPVMLHMLHHYAVGAEPAALGLPDLHSRVPWLRERVQAHFDLAEPERAGEDRSPEEVASQFGELVLIQPNFFGSTQFALQETLIQDDPDFDAFLAEEGSYDRFDVRKPPTFADSLNTRTQITLHDPVALETMLGVSPLAIPRLASGERTDAARLLEGYDLSQIAAAERSLRELLGELPATDAYWLPLQPACQGLLGDEGSARALLEILPRTRTFITNARWDSVTYTEALPALFELMGYDASVDVAAPLGAARPGELVLSSQDQELRVRFPTYESGHSVTVGAPRELGADLAAWLGAR